MTSYAFYPNDQNRILFANLDIWDPENNYIMNGNPYNYIKRLKIKVTSLKASIDYTKSCIDNPEYSRAAKELIFIPTLKGYLRALKTFEKQASLLAA